MTTAAAATVEVHSDLAPVGHQRVSIAPSGEHACECGAKCTRIEFYAHIKKHIDATFVFADRETAPAYEGGPVIPPDELTAYEMRNDETPWWCWR